MRSSTLVIAAIASLPLTAAACAETPLAVAAHDAPLLRFLGRAHAMIVHFPIALLLTAAACEGGSWLRHRRTRAVIVAPPPAPGTIPPDAQTSSNPSSSSSHARNSPPTRASVVAGVCLPLAAVSSVASAWFGWLNAAFEQAGNTEFTLSLHRWFGIAVAGAACACLAARALWRRGSPRAGRVYAIGLALTAALVSYTGHLGGALVYGENYLFEVFDEPKSAVRPGDARSTARPRSPLVTTAAPTHAAAPRTLETAADAPSSKPTTLVDFETEIQPILAARCIECHGPDAQKGGLRLDDIADASAPGGPIRPGDADNSELIERITLPPGEKRFMPRKRDPLSADQVALIRRWINGMSLPPTPIDETPTESEMLDERGAPAESPSDDSAAGRTSEPPSSAPSSASASPRIDTAVRDAAIALVRARGANAQLISADSAAVEVDFSLIGKSVGDADLDLLAGLEATLERLNLSGTGVTDAGIAKLTPFAALRRLNLSRTGVTDAGLRALAGLQNLEQINGVGTPIRDAGVAELVSAVPTLKRVFAWGSGVTAAGVESIRTRRPDVTIELGAPLPASQPAAPPAVPPTGVTEIAAKKKPACCAAAEAKGALCDHACCVEARSKGEICPACGA